MSVPILPPLDGSRHDEIGGDLCKVQRLSKNDCQWAIRSGRLVHSQYFIAQCYFVFIDVAKILA